MDNELRNGLPEEEENTTVEASEEISESADETSEAPAEEETETVNEAEENTVEEENEEALEENDEETSEEDLCIICGENKKGENSDYCPECEAAMYKTRIPFLAWLSGFAVVCVSLFALVIAALISAPAIQTAKGDSAAANNCWQRAYNEYSMVSSYVDEISGIIGKSTLFVQAGRGIDEKIIESYAKSKSPLDAVYMAMMTHGESALKDFKGISEYVEIYDEFYENYTAMSDLIDSMLAGVDKDKTIAAFDALKGKEGINEVYRNYFLFSAADYYKLGYKEELGYIEVADAAAKEQGKDYSWLYYLEIADVLCQEGEYDLALKYAESLAQKDKNNFRAHDIMVKIALAKGDADTASKILAEFKTNNEGYDSAIALESSYYRSSGDAEKSRLICEEGLVSNDFSVELHRHLALIYLLEGDYLKAFDEAFTADSNASYMANYYMDNSGFTPQLDNTIYLCATLCKQNNLTGTTSAQYIDEIIQYYSSFEPSKQVSQILSGEKTIEQVLTEGVCDLA